MNPESSLGDQQAAMGCAAFENPTAPNSQVDVPVISSGLDLGEQEEAMGQSAFNANHTAVQD